VGLRRREQRAGGEGRGRGEGVSVGEEAEGCRSARWWLHAGQGRGVAA